LLRAADLVAREQDGHALREHERGQEVALLARARGVDLRVVGGSLHAAVPRAVVVLAALVVVAVGLVALLAVGDGVLQRAAVVHVNEVPGGEGPPTRPPEEVGGAREAVGEPAERAVAPPPVVAYGVAIFAVPLRPQGREVADLVAALAHVPGLG